VSYLLRHGISVFKVISERPVILTSNAELFAKEKSLLILKFDSAVVSRA
jgi:hypothetical protein